MKIRLYKSVFVNLQQKSNKDMFKEFIWKGSIAV